MLAAQEEKHIQGIAQVLVDEGLLNQEQALEYQQKARENSLNLLQYLAAHTSLSSRKIALAVSKNFGLPYMDLDSLESDGALLNLVSEQLIETHGLIPLFTRGNNLYLGTDDPGKQAAFKEIQFHSGLRTHPIIVETDKLQHFMENRRTSRKNLSRHEDFKDSNPVDGLEMPGDQEEDDAPVVTLVNKVLLDAINIGASDVHFEPYERYFRIRYREDGILREVARPPVALAARITARIKVMSHMDISERRIPQDGRFRMKLSPTRSMDCRVSSCPMIGGEKIVMRILDPEATRLGIDRLGLNPAQKALFLKAIHKPQGMILVTGPTGSGKTVTLYSALNILNRDEVNISTAEDPVEIKIAGINQVHIHPKAGLHFTDTLRSFLRQDPDIIMVGEIRDLETAEIAIKAAQTGHMVLSTLHTQSAAETLTRLLNMGIPSFNIASCVNLIVAQRLARKLCEFCRQTRHDLTVQNLMKLGFSEKEAASLTCYQAVGCARCNKGYKGRVGLYEVLEISKAIEGIIMAKGNSLDILKQAQLEGMITMYQSGLEKIKEGITTIEEVNRVIDYF